ncbi:MAG: hypothetical protein ACREIL_10445 [Nitrospiraceae bacterium]
MAAWGPPGHGKSTWALKVAADLVRIGKTVLYVSAEEGLAESVSERLRRLEIRDEAMLVAGPMNWPTTEAVAREHDCSVIMLDSWSASGWVVPDLDQLRDRFFAVVTLHATKSDEAAGPAAILHVADVVVEVRDGKAKLSKSRWGSVLETEVIHHVE